MSQLSAFIIEGNEASLLPGITSVNGLDKTDVGLSNVDNAQQIPISYLDTDITLAANSDTKVSSQKAVKAYADTKVAATLLGAVNGVATLDSGGDVPLSQLGNAPSAADKAIWVDVPSPAANKGDFRVDAVGATGNMRINFVAPFDFVSLDSCIIVGIPNATFTNQGIDLESDYGAIGEAFNNHSESEVANLYSGTINTFFSLSVAPVLSSLAAGDFVGITVTHGSIGTTINYIGLLLRYNIV